MIISEQASVNAVWKVTTGPSVEPVTVEELKTFARIDGTDEDTQLGYFIKAARSHTENYLNRSLIEQIITLRMDCWPGEKLELPRPPLISITAVETLDELGVATVYDSDYYFVDTISEPGLLIIRNGAVWPQNTDRYYGGFQVRYKAGYGAAGTEVPDAIKEAIKQWSTIMYENRAVGNEVPVEIKAIIDTYKIHYV